jgi:hypothetical protein
LGIMEKEIRYYIVGTRPVKTESDSSGMPVAAYAMDWKTGELKRDDTFLITLTLPSNNDTDEVDEEEFDDFMKGHNRDLIV